MSDFNDKATVSGAIASFSNGADEVPIASGVFSIVPSGGGGTPSAPVAITGHTGMTISHVKKNLLNDNERGFAGGNIYFGHSSGTAYDFSVRLKKGTYTYSVVTADGTSTNLYIRNSDTNTAITGFPAYNVLSKTFTLDEDTNLAVWVYKSGYTAVTDIISAQIETGSTATTYAPFVAPETLAVSWQTEAGTVYGGELNVTTGVLSVTWGILSLAVADMNNSENYPGWKSCGIKNLIGADKGSIAVGDFLVNVGIGLGINTNGSNDICLLPYSSYGLTQTEWQTTYPDLVIQIAVKLATPQTYQLTPHELRTFLGLNNFYCDTGDSEITYYKSGYGYTSVTVNRTGKNLLPNKTYQRNANTLRLGTDTLDGRLSLKRGTYTLSITSDVVIGSLVYTIDGTSTGIQFTSSGTRYYGSFTLSADTDDIFIHVYKSGGITAENVSDIMLEVGSSPSSYEPYVAPISKTAKLHKVIYAGEVDVIKGTATPKNLLENKGTSRTHRGITFNTDDKGIVSISGDNDGTLYSSFPVNSAFPTVSGVTYTISGAVSSNIFIRDVTAAVSDTGSGVTIIGDGTSHNIEIRVSQNYSVSGTVIVKPMIEAKSSASEYAPHFEPFTFTPISMETVEGLNVLYANEGDSTITYRKRAEA